MTTKQALQNCYIFARRRVHRLKRLEGNAWQEHHADEISDWKTIIRFCETAGLQSSILRKRSPEDKQCAKCKMVKGSNCFPRYANWRLQPRCHGCVETKAR